MGRDVRCSAPHWGWALAPIVVNALARGVWAPDEPRYAEVAREVFESKSFLILHRCGELYPDKPPLFYWAIGSIGSISDWNVPLMRLVSIVSVVAMALTTAAFARRWWGEEEARWAPLLLLGMALVTSLGGRLQIDPLLGAFCTSALLVATGPSDNVRSSRGRVLAAGLLTGLGALAKGPVAFVVVGLVLLVWRSQRPKTPSARAGKATILMACMLAVAPVATWASMASLREPALWRPLFFGEHIERAAKGTAHRGPPWQHLLEMPLLLLPWTLPVVLGIVQAWRSWRAKQIGRHSEVDAGLLQAGAWLLTLFVFFSITPAKRELYLLPAYPAAALLGARWLVRAVRSDRFPLWVGWFSTALLALSGVAVSGGAWMASRADERLHSLAGAGSAAGLALLALSIPSALSLLSKEWDKWAYRAAVSWSLGLTIGGMLLLPAIDPVKSTRTIAEAIAHLPQKPNLIPCFGEQPEGFRFYSGLPFAAAPVLAARGVDLSAIQAHEGDAFLGVFRQDEWDRLPVEQRQRLHILIRSRLGSSGVLVAGTAKPER